MKAYDLFRKMVQCADEIYLHYNNSECRITAQEVRDCSEAHYCPGYYEGEFSPAGHSPAAVLGFVRANPESIEDMCLYATTNGKVLVTMDISRDLWEGLSAVGMSWYTADDTYI